MQPQILAEIPEEIQQELSLLRGFKDLVAERTGYMFGNKALGKTMSDETADERKAVSSNAKLVRQALAVLIEKPNRKNSDAYTNSLATHKVAKEGLATVRKPHMTKISPLRKAVRYIDVVAVPDSLVELGSQATPRFSLSDWVIKALA